MGLTLAFGLAAAGSASGAWEWPAEEKARIETAQKARDAKTPESLAFLLTGFDDPYESVAIRCMDYVKRMVLKDNVACDRDALAAFAMARIPASTVKRTEKLVFFLADVGPGDEGRTKIESLLEAEDAAVSIVALKALANFRYTRDFMADLRDYWQFDGGKPAGTSASLDAIARAAERFPSDTHYQLYAIRAIGILGEEKDAVRLAAVLNPEDPRNASPQSGYEADRLIYALRACPKFQAGKALIEPFLASPNRKVQKEAEKALKEWTEKHP
jgi:hypothetical protein